MPGPEFPVGRQQIRSLIVTSRGDDDQVTALAIAAGHGDARALEDFIRATQRDVWRFTAHLADIASADDLTQETFLRAIKSLPRFSGRSSARTWLLSIARRAAVDQVRYNQARPRITHGADLEQAANRQRSPRGFEDLVEVNVLLSGLDSDRREALLLTQVLGLSYAEAAAVCQCPVGTIRSRIARAREDLLGSAQQDDLTG
ncbi:RNA polymerase sigma factor SigC [Mycolicibacterium komossense]|uniref:RNA polymerase sigma factor n=1 Tax=Mycolicibacterium komossense TaxID=1779 RepID=A0ABT3CG70_9MYCO|nr:RNA polymerase sigma factor SigC [Mycolicibacterium komossense]